MFVLINYSSIFARIFLRLLTQAASSGLTLFPVFMFWSRLSSLARSALDLDACLSTCAETFYGAFVLIVASSSTPWTRRLLDGVAVPVPRRSTEPAGRVITEK